MHDNMESDAAEHSLTNWRFEYFFGKEAREPL